MFAGQETINNKGQITNQENFNKALLAIMEDRYTGGAEKLSKTTKGMWSTITGVTKNALAKIVGIQDDGTVKSGTLIDKIREKMQLLGDKLTKWQSDGTLDNIASKATQVFNTIYNVISKVFNFVVQHKDIIITIASMAVAFTVVSKAIRGLSVATKAFQLVWALLNGTIALTPIGWIIIGITALVGAFVLAYTKSEKFRNAVNKLLIKLKELGSSVVNWYNSDIKPTLTNIMNSLKQLWDEKLKPLLQWVSDKLGPLFIATWEAIKSTVEPILTLVGDLIKDILKYLQGVIDFLIGVFTGDWDKAWAGIKTTAQSAIDTITDLWNGLKNLIQAPIKAVVNVEKKVYGDNKGWNPLTGVAGIIGKHANGTNYYKGGYTWVGEHGPELLKLPGGSQIKTNSQSKKIANEKTNMPSIQVIIQGNVIGNESFINQVGAAVWNKVNLALLNS
jgi:phage-related tail protein